MINTLPSLSSYNTRAMGAKQSTSRLDPARVPPPRVPNVQFRVLIIGRANAGKTSILQRVCDTTESPVIYRSGPSGTSQVCAHCQWRSNMISWSVQVKLDHGIEVGCPYSFISATADHEDPVNSVAFTTLMMNSFSRTTMDTFSMTLAVLRQVVETS